MSAFAGLLSGCRTNGLGKADSFHMATAEKDLGQAKFHLKNAQRGLDRKDCAQALSSYISLRSRMSALQTSIEGADAPTPEIVQEHKALQSQMKKVSKEIPTCTRRRGFWDKLLSR